MQRILSVFAIVALLFVFGCTPASPLVPVKGRVTFDGAPVESGLVEFEPVDRNNPSAKGGIITNGDYTAEVPPGELKVKITASKSTGKRKMYEDANSPLVDIMEQYLPKKYNDESDLKVNVAGKKDDLDFVLKSK